LPLVGTERGERRAKYGQSVKLAQCLQNRGARVTYACRPGEFVESLCRAGSIQTFPLFTRNSRDLRAVRSLIQQIIRRRIDLVHVHSRRDFVAAVLAVAGARLYLRRRDKRPALVLRAHLMKSLGTPPLLSGYFFRQGADAVVAVSEAVRAFLTRIHRLDQSFITTIYNDVDGDVFDPTAPKRSAWRERLRQHWKVPSEATVIGMIGRLDSKGQATLLLAAPRLLARFPEVYFVFAGPEGEGGSRETLEKLAGAERVDHLVFAGLSEDIPAVLATFDILAHLPSEEAFGLVLVEAMAMGLPIVAARVGGCAEVVEDEKTGFLVPPDDQHTLLTALSALLGKNGRVLAAQFTEAGQERSRSLFSLARQVEALELLYAKVLSSCSTQP